MNAPWMTFDRYPQFSSEEMARRRAALIDVMAAGDVDHLVMYGWQRPGSPVQWFTGWPVTREGVVVVSPADRDVLFVQFYNHLPNARDMVDTAEVRWAGEVTIETVAEELRRRGAAPGRVGVIGPLPHDQYLTLAAAFGELKNLYPGYRALRLVSSPEEVDWFRVGAEMSDRAVDALRDSLQAGLTEHDLADIVERSYVPYGGQNHIHFFGVTPMDSPERCVPAQHPSARRLATGDMLATEISATYYGYPGQVLKTFTIDRPPTALYEELFAVATKVFDDVFALLRDGVRPGDLVDAAAPIDEAGFTIYDDLVHCFGGGGEYGPVLARRSTGPATERAGSWDIADEALRTNMTVVIQPNVITLDESAGVQLGELVLITPDGCERLHRSPLGLEQVG